jgi:hypothetical protein
MTVASWRSRSTLGAELAFWLAGVALTLCACAADERYVVIGSARAPSASGIVELDDIGDGKAKVAVHLEFLHPPSRMNENLKHFAVWFQPKEGSPVLAGDLKFDPAQRTGDLTGTSPFHEFVVKVTAEKDGRPAAPSDYVVAVQEVSID